MTTEIKQQTFMKLYEPVHVNLNRYVHSIMRNNEDAKDVISETILKAYENFEKINKPESFIYYLFKIASNTIHNRNRRKKFWTDLDQTHSENIPDQAGDVISKTEMKEFYAELNKMPTKQKEAIVLFEISGLSLNEIQQIQGGSLSGVKSRIGRGRQHLEQKLEYTQKISITKTPELK
ncbi:MAG: RNA polymerase sigma factor [Bacteroidota bacterium]